MNLSKDAYLTIAEKSDVKTLLNMLAVNKSFNDEKTFKYMMFRMYPNLAIYKTDEESWKRFFLQMLYYILKLKEEYDYTFSKRINERINKNPMKIYKWYKLLEKIDKWRNQEIDYFTLYDSPNIYDMLYNIEGNGNHDSLGSWLFSINFDEIEEFTPHYIFGDESALYELTGDLRPVDALVDHTYLPFDYNYLLTVLERNGKLYKSMKKNWEENLIGLKSILNFSQKL